MTISTHTYFSTLLAAALLSLAGCGGSGSSESTGFLSLSVSDHPMHDAEKVCITFDQIEFQGDGGRSVVYFDPPEKVNLLEFQGDNAAPILMGHELPAGHYQWMRLGVDAVRGSNGGVGDSGGDMCDGEASYIVMDDGSFHNMYIPSGAQTGLKLVGGFTVPTNATASFTAEIDLMKSITEPPGQYPDVKFRPTIRLVNNVEVGTLTGEVSEDLATADACEPSVFVFDGGIEPNPIDDGDVVDPNDPVATAMVKAQSNSDGTTTYHYTIGFLLAGNYNVAFTCDGETFEPPAGKAVTIEAQQLKTVDFP